MSMYMCICVYEFMFMFLSAVAFAQTRRRGPQDSNHEKSTAFVEQASFRYGQPASSLAVGGISLG